MRRVEGGKEGLLQGVADVATGESSLQDLDDAFWRSPMVEEVAECLDAYLAVSRDLTLFSRLSVNFAFLVTKKRITFSLVSSSFTHSNIV